MFKKASGKKPAGMGNGKKNSPKGDLYSNKGGVGKKGGVGGK